MGEEAMISKSSGEFNMNHRLVKFEEIYKQICYRNDIFPQKSVLAHLNNEILDICNAERLTQQDIDAILLPLSSNRTLRFLAFRSCNIHEPTDNRLKQKSPAVQNSGILSNICKSISNCLCYNNQLTSLELENLLLDKSSLDIILQGLIANRSINHLGFRDSPIGDDGIEVISKALRRQSNIKTLDLTNCNISLVGAKTIAYVIQIQNMQNHSITWKDSLRDQHPVLDKVGGLARISLSHNRQIGDEGVKHIVNAISENVCLKAIDLQNCDLTSVGGTYCIEMLKNNNALAVVDIRNNPGIGEEILVKVKLELEQNINGKISEVKWLKSVNISSANKEVKFNQHKQCVPWRVEERLKKVRGYPQTHIPGLTILEECLDTNYAGSVLMTNDKNCLNCQTLQEELYCTHQSLNTTKAEVKRLQSELNQVRDERNSLQRLLKEWPAQHKQNNPFMDEETFLCVKNTFEKFQGFLYLLQDTGVNEVLKVNKFENSSQFLNLIEHGKPKHGINTQNTSSEGFISTFRKKSPEIQNRNEVFVHENLDEHVEKPITIVKSASKSTPSSADQNSAFISSKSFSSHNSNNSGSNCVSSRSGSSSIPVSDCDVQELQKKAEISDSADEVSEMVVKDSHTSSKSDSNLFRDSSQISEVIKNASEISESLEKSQSYSSDFVSEEDDTF